jgi:hypothetical protein
MELHQTKQDVVEVLFLTKTLGNVTNQKMCQAAKTRMQNLEQANVSNLQWLKTVEIEGQPQQAFPRMHGYQRETATL